VNTPQPPSSHSPVEIDRLVHEPARLVIMATLFVVDEADFVYLAQQTGLTAGNMNSHIARLVDGGYVSVEKTFAANRPRTIYQLTEEGRTSLQNYRQQVGNLLAQIGTSTPPSTRT
jgi:DNA-binding MarR family transcriptional regulator